MSGRRWRGGGVMDANYLRMALVVDGDAAARTRARWLLVHGGYRVRQADNHAACIAAIDAAMPDLVIVGRSLIPEVIGPVSARTDGRDAQAQWSLAGLVVDARRRDVHVDGRPIRLTRTEFDILALLIGSSRRVYSRREVLDAVWGPGWFGDEHLVDAHVSKLRRKLGDDPRAPAFIETVRGVGFRMADGSGAQWPDGGAPGAGPALG